MILGLLAASRAGNADMANAAMAGGQARGDPGPAQFLARHGARGRPRRLTACWRAAGFSTAGMAAMFEKMDFATRLNDNGGFPYLRSHPLTVDRISEARSRALLDSGAPAGAAAAPCADADARARAHGRQRAGACSGWAARPRRRCSSTAWRRCTAAPWPPRLLNDHPRAEAQASEALRLAATATPREPAAEARAAPAAGPGPAGARRRRRRAGGAGRHARRQPASARRCCCARRRRWTCTARPAARGAATARPAPRHRVAADLAGRPPAGRRRLGGAGRHQPGARPGPALRCAPAPRRARRWATSAAPSTACVPRQAVSRKDGGSGLHRSLGHRHPAAPARGAAAADRCWKRATAS